MNMHATKTVIKCIKMTNIIDVLNYALLTYYSCINIIIYVYVRHVDMTCVKHADVCVCVCVRYVVMVSGYTTKKMPEKYSTVIKS